MTPLPRPTRALACCLVFLAGCGGATSSVAGTVTLDGTQIDSGTVTFVPQSGDGAKFAGHVAEGKYAIAADRGAKPGKYKVELTWDKKTGKKKSDGDGGFTFETVQSLPPQFNTASTQTAEVKSGAQTIDFPLTSK